MFGNLEALQAFAEHFHPSAADIVGKQGAKLVADLEAEVWTDIARLYRDAPWKKLSSDPVAFNKRLGAVQKEVGQKLKHLYGLPSHRPQKLDRNRAIWKMHQEHPMMSFGKIGLKFHVSGKVAERAAKRHQEREKMRLRRFIELTWPRKKS